MKTNMKANESPVPEISSAQAAGSHVKESHPSNSNCSSSTQIKTADNSDYASTNYASNDSDYTYKAPFMSKDESMTNEKLDYKRSRSGAESRKSENITANLEHVSISSGYKKMSAVSEDVFAQKTGPINKVQGSNQSDAAAHPAFVVNDDGDNTHDTHKKITSKKEVSAMQSSKFPERIFMNGLLKHTAIALAIIVPLAAISAYAAPQAMPISTAENGKTTTKTIEIEPSTIIHQSSNQPTTVERLDLKQYAGTWYEIGRLPMYFQRKCASDVTATYTEKTDGSGITVLNKCIAEDGKAINAEGLAKPADDTGSKLKVTFLPSWIRWLPVGRADYWVLAHDPSYQTALVGTPDKDYLWLLARSPNISQQTYAKYRQIAQQQGYDLKEFKLTNHANQTVKLVP